MFHFAAPEVNGFGVRTLTPGLSRSSHVLMFLGLPLRTTKVTTDVVTRPLFGPAFQSSATRPAFTSRVMSGSVENVTTSAFWPASTARLWSPDAP
jgi:hypothetical protein